MNFKEFLEKEKIEGIKSIKVEGSRESPNEDTEYNCWEALVEDSEGDFDIPFIIKTEESIPIKALGEWAWKYLLRSGLLKFAKENANVFDKLNMVDGYILTPENLKQFIVDKNLCYEARDLPELLVDIAIVCLGESEVKKRLEEIK